MHKKIAELSEGLGKADVQNPMECRADGSQAVDKAPRGAAQWIISGVFFRKCFYLC